jgi:hypothetical protein
MCGGSPSIPPPPEIPKPPPPPPRKPQTPNPVAKGENTAQLAAANKRGRGSTILTGSRGDLSTPDTDKKTLLGY